MKKKDKITIFIFWCALIFSVTGLRLIWSIESVSRMISIAMFFSLTGLVIFSLFKRKYLPLVWGVQIIPGLLIVIGISMNVLINALMHFEINPIIGSVIPWLMYTLMPFLEAENRVDSRKMWEHFYLFMLIINFLGVLEYFFIFEGAYTPRVIDTAYGEFYAGYISLFHKLDDGMLHYRYYSAFLEPGTLAMYLLPAIIFALINRKYIGLIIFCYAMYLTDSLGGLIGLFIILIISPFILIPDEWKGCKILVLISTFCFAVLMTAIIGTTIGEKYEDKQKSAEIRESQAVDIIDTWPLLILDSPFGIELKSTTEDFKKNNMYIGSNFTPSIYLQFGGVIALLGYVVVLAVSFVSSMCLFFKSDLEKHDRLVLSTVIVMFPFIVQRGTIWETSLFALLLSTVLIRIFQSIIKS